jgi:hypothetical protein
VRCRVAAVAPVQQIGGAEAVRHVDAGIAHCFRQEPVALLGTHNVFLHLSPDARRDSPLRAARNQRAEVFVGRRGVCLPVTRCADLEASI